MKTIYPFVMILLALPFTQILNASETIVWIHSDFPPYNISTGKDKGQGSVDLVEKLLIEALPNYQHVRINANYARMTKEIRTKKNVCSAGLVKTPERSKYTEYSIPYSIALANRLITNTENSKLLHSHINNQSVDLDSLLKSQTFLLGISKGRRYGGGIDHTLEKHKDSPAIFERVGNDQLEGLIKMLAISDRPINGILGYNSAEVSYISRKLGIDAKQFKYYSIKGGAPYNLGYVGCSKSTLGRTVINQINQIVAKVRKNKIADIFGKWLDNDVLDEYEKHISEEFAED